MWQINPPAADGYRLHDAGACVRACVRACVCWEFLLVIVCSCARLHVHVHAHTCVCVCFGPMTFPLWCRPGSSTVVVNLISLVIYSMV